MLRFLSLLLAICLLPCFAFGEGGSDAPSKEDLSLYEAPFILNVKSLDEAPEGFTALYTYDDIPKIAENPDGKFILMDNIHFPSGNTLRLVGFTGELNGNGYALTGVDMQLQLSPRDTLYIGLFGWIRDASVSNLRIEGTCRVKDSGHKKCRAYAGGIAGRAMGNSTVRNCVSFMDIQFDKDIVDDHFGCYGGVLGQMDAGTTVSHCHYLGTLNVPENAGGIIGCAEAGAGAPAVYACMNSGVVMADSWYAGGIVGKSIGSLAITSCANSGEVFSMNSAGGILGYAEDDKGMATVRDCLNEGTIATTDAPVSPTGGIVGNGECYVINCLNVGRVLGNPVSAIHTGVKDPAMLQNNYYSDAMVYASRPTNGDYELTDGQLSADQLQAEESFPGFSFPAVWTLNEGMTHPFPTPLVLDYRWINYSPDAWDSDVEDIRGNTVREQAIEDIMNSYEFTDDEIAGTIICFAEGYGAYPYEDSTYKRSTALLVVWKNGQIVFACDDCATYPDQPFNATANGGTNVPTVVDGKYAYVGDPHMGYPSLNVVEPDVCRLRPNDAMMGISVGIDIHVKDSDGYGGIRPKDNSPWVNSAGCFLVGSKGSGSSLTAKHDYARFGYLLGFAKENANAPGYARISSGASCPAVKGIVVVNRAYGYINVPEFRENLRNHYTRSGVFRSDVLEGFMPSLEGNIN